MPLYLLRKCSSVAVNVGTIGFHIGQFSILIIVFFLFCWFSPHIKCKICYSGTFTCNGLDREHLLSGMVSHVTRSTSIYLVEKRLLGGIIPKTFDELKIWRRSILFFIVPYLQSSTIIENLILRSMRTVQSLSSQYDTKHIFRLIIIIEFYNYNTKEKSFIVSIVSIKNKKVFNEFVIFRQIHL